MACSYPLGLQQLISASEAQIKAWCPQGGRSKKYVLTMADDQVIVEAKDEPGPAPTGSSHGKLLCADIYDTQDDLVFSLRQAHTLALVKIDVFMSGALASVLRQKPGTMLPVLHIHEPVTDAIVLRLKYYLFAREYKLLTLEKTQIGGISMRVEGCSKKAPKPKGVSFTVRFPQDLDVRHKAAVIATAMFTDHLITK